MSHMLRTVATPRAPAADLDVPTYPKDFAAPALDQIIMPGVSVPSYFRFAPLVALASSGPRRRRRRRAPTCR